MFGRACERKWSENVIMLGEPAKYYFADFHPPNPQRGDGCPQIPKSTKKQVFLVTLHFKPPAEEILKMVFDGLPRVGPFTVTLPLLTSPKKFPSQYFPKDRS